MRREYNLYVNGSKISDGDNKLIVNGVNVRRCIVNGVDVIKNIAQLRVQLNFTASITAYSEYIVLCSTTDVSGFSGWTIDKLTLSSLTNDFTILSANFRLSISDGDAYDKSAIYTDSKNRNFTSFPLTMNNVNGDSDWHEDSARYIMSWNLYAKFDTLRVRYEPTGEVFNISNKAILLQQGEIREETDTWDRELTFNITTPLLVLEEEVSQY